MEEFLVVFVVLSLTVSVHASFPFQNVSLPWDDRVNDLVGRLTLDEIVAQMARGGGGTSGGPAPAIPRLGIKPYQWNTECLRGVALSGKATAFAQSINLGATFSWRLMETVAMAIGTEVRAKYNYHRSLGEYGDHQGVSCFSPMINMMRHPLWGRNQEVYGEDPYLTGRLAQAYIKGLHGNNSRYVQATTTCKAYAAYAGPENIPVSRLTFDAKVPERDLHLTYLPAYKACSDAGVFSYMCSYNSVNGIPSCTNDKLLSQILRKQWGFKGYVISDMGAIEGIVETHKYYNNTLETVVGTVTAGCNLELSLNLKDPYYMHIGDAVNKGLLNESLIRNMAKPLFYTRMRTGEFDPPDLNPYTKYDMSLVQSEEHRQLAVKSAMKSFVLLKNDGLLPLKKSFHRIALIGPMADNLDQLYGDYNADIDPKYGKTPLQGLLNMSYDVNYGPGCKDNKCDKYDPSEVKKAVVDTDVELIVACLGTGVELECEGVDRADMNLPGKQAQIVKDALFYAPGVPLLLVLFTAGPVNVSFADVDPRVNAILQCFFPAQATGEALYNVITMATEDASPAGRLPYTWYNTSDQIPSMTNYSMANRTYRYFTGAPAYPFGYGLSYTTFSYSNLTYSSTITAGSDLNISVVVGNTGNVNSDEVAQVYIHWLTTKEVMPRLQLVAFDRLLISSHSFKIFNFTIRADQFAVWTEDKGFIIEEGDILLYVGGQQPFQKRKVPSNILSGKLHIQGSKILH